MIGRGLTPFLLTATFIAARPAHGDEPKSNTLRGHDRWVAAVAFSPDGRQLVTGGGDDVWKLWDVATGKELRSRPAGCKGVTAVAFRPDGRCLATGGWDGPVTLWDTATGKEQRSLRGHAENVTSLAYRPDGRRIVSGSGDDTLRIWDPATGKSLRTLDAGNQYDATAVAFSGDSKSIMAGDGVGGITLWDAESGEQLRTLEGHRRSVTAVALGRDGKVIASASRDGTVHLWDRATGKELLTIEGHAADVTAVAFLPDGKRIVTGSDAILDRGRPKFDGAAVQLLPQGKNRMREHIELMMDLIALAFQTDMTRVVTHSLGGEGGPNYDEYRDWAMQAKAPVRGAHDVHHKGGNGGEDSPDSRVLAARDEMLCACLARLLEKLQGVRAADGTLLDHTVLLFGGAQIRSHSGKSFPTLLAGGHKLGFRHGQHLKWESNKKPMSDLYLTILQQLGCPVTAFKESAGPISELLA